MSTNVNVIQTCTVSVTFQVPGADTGFQKGGGGGVRVTVKY